MTLSFIYVVDYGDYYDGSCAHFPLIFSEVESALACARKNLERMKGGIESPSSYAIVREYFRPDFPGQPWHFVQICMVHKDEEWISNEVDEVHGSSPV